jgi:hypothetical protein
MQSLKEFDFSTFQFQDKRHARRFSHLMTSLLTRPNSSIPEACASHAATKAAYRFLDSSRIETAQLNEGIYKKTVKDIANRSYVLIPQDTTSLNFSSLSATTGLGHIDPKQTQGLLMHTAFCISPDGLPLGVIDHHIWARENDTIGKRKTRRTKPTSQKESQRWITTEERVEERIPPSVDIIMIADREADIYDYIARKRRRGCKMLIRFTHDRCIADDTAHRVFAQLETSAVQGVDTIAVTDATTGKARTASVTYRWTQVTLLPPNGRMIACTEPVSVWVIMVREENAPDGVTPIEWKLMTTIAITSLDDVRQCVRWYSYRWLIERFHYVLKSGCQVEKLQLESAERLQRAIALYVIVAWRLLHMTYLARLHPETSAEHILAQHQWEALYCAVNKTPTPPASAPNVKNAVRMIAMLGGFLGRKGDGTPGVKVLWRGLKRLDDIAETYLLHVVLRSKGDVGNG